MISHRASMSRTGFHRSRMEIAMKIGRNAGSGKFTTVKQAKAKPKTHVVETVKPAPKGK